MTFDTAWLFDPKTAVSGHNCELVKGLAEGLLCGRAVCAILPLYRPYTMPPVKHRKVVMLGYPSVGKCRHPACVADVIVRVCLYYNTEPPAGMCARYGLGWRYGQPLAVVVWVACCTRVCVCVLGEGQACFLLSDHNDGGGGHNSSLWGRANNNVCWLP